jgi:hypothetical protein
MAGRDPKTVKTQRELHDPLLAEIGHAILRDLEADDVGKALGKLGPRPDHANSGCGSAGPGRERTGAPPVDV